MLFSFNANELGTFPITGWTTKWYSQVFGDYEIQDALRTTLKVGAQVTLVSVVVGTAAAFPLVRSRLPFPSGFRVVMTLPIMIPGILIGVSLLILFTSILHKELSPETAVVGQSLYTTPFVLLLVSARLQGFDQALERAASDLGANTFNRLRYIVLPLTVLTGSSSYAYPSSVFCYQHFISTCRNSGTGLLIARPFICWVSHRADSKKP